MPKIAQKIFDKNGKLTTVYKSAVRRSTGKKGVERLRAIADVPKKDLSEKDRKLVKKVKKNMKKIDAMQDYTVTSYIWPPNTSTGNPNR